MTITEAVDRITKIRALAKDPEAAHCAEDEFREDVLRAIAEGSDKAAELAGLALVTSAIEFDRWYS